MTSPRRPHLIALVLAGFALAAVQGCTTNPATGQQELTVIGPEQEASIGRDEHPKIIKEFGGVYEEDPELNAYVAGIGARLRAVSELNNKPFTFTLLDSPVVNAFALPGGYVYVTRGLLALANSEAELAGVIAHEIGHVTARHTANRVTTGLFANLGAAVLGAALGSQAVADLAQVGAAAAVQSYSREQEMEADTLGVRYLTRAGYDPHAMASFLGSLQLDSQLEAKLAGREGREAEHSLFSSHPRTGDRIKRAADAAEGTLVAEPKVNRDGYLERIAGMLYGDSPEEGFIKGRTFAHPGLGFGFDVPEGFRLNNSTEAVVAVRKDGAAIRFDGAQVGQGADLRHYLAQDWLAQANLVNVEALTVNGMAAATGVARGQTRSGPVDVRGVVVRYDANQIYRFLFVTPAKVTASLDQALRETTYSFRPLTAAEKAGLKPTRVELVRVNAGDTHETFARMMPFEDLPLDRFRTLNGLAPNQPLQAGQLVKIVVE